MTLAPTSLNSLAEILVEKGNRARDRIASTTTKRSARSIYEVPGRNRGESFTTWVQRVGNPMTLGYDVIYQMPFVHEGIRGIADFLVKVDEPDRRGTRTYEPVDAKLTRSEGKPGHVLQLCFYAEAMEALVGSAPRRCTSGWARARPRP